MQACEPHETSAGDPQFSYNELPCPAPVSSSTRKPESLLLSAHYRPRGRFGYRVTASDPTSVSRLPSAALQPLEPCRDRKIFSALSFASKVPKGGERHEAPRKIFLTSSLLSYLYSTTHLWCRQPRVLSRQAYRAVRSDRPLRPDFALFRRQATFDHNAHSSTLCKRCCETLVLRVLRTGPFTTSRNRCLIGTGLLSQ